VEKAIRVFHQVSASLDDANILENELLSKISASSIEKQTWWKTPVPFSTFSIKVDDVAYLITIKLFQFLMLTSCIEDTICLNFLFGEICYIEGSKN
jgi:hypothetical protein